MTMDELVIQAAAEGWKISPPTLERKPIEQDGNLVGFFCPHPAGRGRWRVGPIYVHPDYRGRGLGLQAYGEWSKAVPLVAYTHPSNVQSARLHERAGFVRWYQTRSGGQYWKRDA
jgi:RimJ/RimL family protein N-acetyltransferase